MKVWLLLVALFVLNACKSGPQLVARTPKIPKGAKIYPTQQLTSAGESDRGVYSRDGSSLFFISRQRTGHEHWQGYQYFFSSGRDRRLTFHDGDVESIIPGFKPNEMIYASSTDEIKELPDFIRKATQKDLTPDLDFFGQPLPRTEIYLSDLNGDKIVRLTKSAGYDGDLSYRPLKNEYAFVSIRNKNLDIYAMIGGELTRITSLKEHDFSPAISEKGELAFIRGSTEMPKVSQLFVADRYNAKAVAITSKSAAHIDPQWHPEVPWIVFAMNYPDPLNYELYWVRKDGKCLERLTYTAENESSPSFSPDGKDLVFTREVSGQRQLFVMKELPTPECTEEVASPSATR